MGSSFPVGDIQDKTVKTLILILSLSLAGCATCRENPTACAIAAAGVIVGGCILARHHDRQTVVLKYPVPHVHE